MKHSTFLLKNKELSHPNVSEFLMTIEAIPSVFVYQNKFFCCLGRICRKDMFDEQLLPIFFMFPLSCTYLF